MVSTWSSAEPLYAPIDEYAPPSPESSYALSKVLAEEMARQFSRWSGATFVALRFSNIMEPADYARFPTYWGDRSPGFAVARHRRHPMRWPT